MSAKRIAISLVVGYDRRSHHDGSWLPYSRLICLAADVTYGYGPSAFGWERDAGQYPILRRWARWLGVT